MLELNGEMVIGKGEKGDNRYTSITKEKDCIHYAYENNTRYRFNQCIFDIKVAIFKNTKEGKKIKKMIDSKKSLSYIRNYADESILSKLSPVELRARIEIERHRSFTSGQKAKTKEILKVLGLGLGCFDGIRVDS